MYNPRVVKKDSEASIVTLEAAETIAVNDFVTILTDGEAEVSGAGEGIFGVALEAATDGDNVRVLRAHPGMTVIMDNDNLVATFSADHIGGRMDITGTTGAQLVDTDTVAQDGSDSGQLFCIGYNPQGYGFDSDTSIGLYEIAEIQGLTNAIT